MRYIIRCIIASLYLETLFRMIYITWDMQKVKVMGNTIYDRWFT